MQVLGIVSICVLAAVGYGILHDQITARICLEYFTVAHPPVFATQSPTLLAVGWGIIATWWVGVLLGLPLAIAARAGRPPMRDLVSLLNPVLALLGVMACCALLSGLAGYLLGRSGAIQVTEPLAAAIPAERHARFLADRWAHDASYLSGVVGGLVVIVQVWRSRGKGWPRVRSIRLIPRPGPGGRRGGRGV